MCARSVPRRQRSASQQREANGLQFPPETQPLTGADLLLADQLATYFAQRHSEAVTRSDWKMELPSRADLARLIAAHVDRRSAATDSLFHRQLEFLPSDWIIAATRGPAAAHTASNGVPAFSFEMLICVCSEKHLAEERSDLLARHLYDVEISGGGSAPSIDA